MQFFFVLSLVINFEPGIFIFKQRNLLRAAAVLYMENGGSKDESCFKAIADKFFMPGSVGVFVCVQQHENINLKR
jgi:hypothetical protein